MSKLIDAFNKVTIDVMDKSGVDLSHENLFTCSVGTLTPCLVEPVQPSDTFSLGAYFNVKLPPFATDFYGHIDAKAEFFFVPNRILWGGWQNFIVNDGTVPNRFPGVSPELPTAAPQYNLPTETNSTLADYLGVKSVQGTNAQVNVLPFLAYHKIWDDYYRDANITKPFFYDAFMHSTNQVNVANLPHYQSVQNQVFVANDSSSSNNQGINSLHQRCWAKDAYTTMLPQPQNGLGAELSFDIQQDEGSFTIRSLRAANALQKWMDRNALGSLRYYDQIKAHFGITPSDAAFNRPIFLGSISTPIYVNSVNQTSNYVDDAAGNRNPFRDSVGASYGKALAVAKDSVFNDFTATEHGFIMGIFSIVPHANYSTGISKHLFRKDGSDYPWPEFAAIGDEPVYGRELFGEGGQVTIGYNRRYYDSYFHNDEVHGQFVAGQPLEAFVLQRGFSSRPSLSTLFLEIPTDALDEVLAVTSDNQAVAMVDMWFDFKALRRLPESPLPHL